MLIEPVRDTLKISSKMDEKELEKYTAAAEAGDASAQYNLGVLLSEGDKKQQKKAFAWTLKSAKQGFAKGQSLLAHFYINGIGVGQNPDKAYDWYKKAAMQGEAKAERFMGLDALHGVVGEKDVEAATEWLRKAATHGSDDASCDLAGMLQRGEGMKQDLDEAYHLFEQLAEKGLPAAKYNLAIFCLDGYPNGREAQRAVQLLEEAAAGGVKIAHVTLAQIYMEGVDDVQQDFATAQNWTCSFEAYRQRCAERNRPPRERKIRQQKLFNSFYALSDELDRSSRSDSSAFFFFISSQQICVPFFFSSPLCSPLLLPHNRRKMSIDGEWPICARSNILKPLNRSQRRPKRAILPQLCSSVCSIIKGGAWSRTMSALLSTTGVQLRKVTPRGSTS